MPNKEIAYYNNIMKARLEISEEEGGYYYWDVVADLIGDGLLVHFDSDEEHPDKVEYTEEADCFSVEYTWKPGYLKCTELLMDEIDEEEKQEEKKRKILFDFKNTICYNAFKSNQTQPTTKGDIKMKNKKQLKKQMKKVGVFNFIDVFTGEKRTTTKKCQKATQGKKIIVSNKLEIYVDNKGYKAVPTDKFYFFDTDTERDQILKGLAFVVENKYLFWNENDQEYIIPGLRK